MDVIGSLWSRFFIIVLKMAKTSLVGAISENWKKKNLLIGKFYCLLLLEPNLWENFAFWGVQFVVPWTRKLERKPFCFNHVFHLFILPKSTKAKFSQAMFDFAISWLMHGWTGDHSHFWKGWLILVDHNWVSESLLHNHALIVKSVQE